MIYLLCGRGIRCAECHLVTVAAVGSLAHFSQSVLFRQHPSVFFLGKTLEIAVDGFIPQPIYGPVSATAWVSWCQKRTSGLYGARED